MKIIIEHLEPRLWKWCILEYKHISQLVGKKNLIFTCVKKKDAKKLSTYGKVYISSIKELHFRNACVLDPAAEKTLSPREDSRFDFLVLGGILGNFPMKRRTKKELTSVLGYPARNLGRQQMSTNTAAYVAWKIVHGKPLSSLQFTRQLVIPAGNSEEIILPYRYLIEGGKVVLPDGYLSFIKRKGF